MRWHQGLFEQGKERGQICLAQGRPLGQIVGTVAFRFVTSRIAKGPVGNLEQNQEISRRLGRVHESSAMGHAGCHSGRQRP